jgi:hypothetical protein
MARTHYSPNAAIIVFVLSPSRTSKGFQGLIPKIHLELDSYIFVDI